MTPVVAAQALASGVQAQARAQAGVGRTGQGTTMGAQGVCRRELF